MRADANDYRLRIQYIKDLVSDKDSDERYDFISLLSIASGIPVIVVVHYLIELYGPEDRLYDLADRLKLFYDIREVLNVKERT